MQDITQMEAHQSFIHYPAFDIKDKTIYLSRMIALTNPNLYSNFYSHHASIFLMRFNVINKVKIKKFIGQVAQ